MEIYRQGSAGAGIANVAAFLRMYLDVENRFASAHPEDVIMELRAAE